MWPNLLAEMSNSVSTWSRFKNGLQIWPTNYHMWSKVRIRLIFIAREKLHFVWQIVSRSDGIVSPLQSQVSSLEVAFASRVQHFSLLSDSCNWISIVFPISTESLRSFNCSRETPAWNQTTEGWQRRSWLSWMLATTNKDVKKRQRSLLQRWQGKIDQKEIVSVPTKDHSQDFRRLKKGVQWIIFWPET